MSNSLSRYATALALCVLWPLCAMAAPPKSQDREALRKALMEVLSKAPLSGSRSAVEVQSLDTGEVIFQQDSDELLNPASNVKLFTAAAALSLLGSEFRFQTEFLTDAEPVDGKVKTLYVRGKGDPLLDTERLYAIISELHHFGLREVGNIVIDDSYFDTQRSPPGYEQDDSDRAYMAPTGAVSFNLNTVGVYLRPSEAGKKTDVELEPASDYFVVENHSVTTQRGRYRRFAVSSKAYGAKQKIVVHGTLSTEKGAVSVWKKIDNPPMYFGDTLKAMLKQRGIKVRGRVKLGLAPKNAHALYVHQSETFDVVLKRMDKMSSNFIAEQLVKTLGAELKGAPGTTEKGVEVIEEFLESQVGIPRGTYVLKNGSGLNDTNRFSARQITKLLTYMYKHFPIAPEYLSSMGIAAKDGTLRYRFDGSEAAGRLRAKTGTLYNVCALSGYVVSVGGEKFAFSMLINDYPGSHGDVIRGLDALGTAVAASGSKQGPGVAVAKLTGPAQDDANGQAEARIKTYLALAKQSDRRNLDFLRTAWRTEKDPAVRAVVAEAIYQSNPQDYFGARALLESFAAGDQVYGRLRTFAKALKVDVPAVGSVVELASQGNQEAIARVLELTPAAQGDEAARTELTRSLVEIARTAPEELVLALKAANVKAQSAAEALLAHGLADEAANHPFWPSVKKLSGAADRSTATFAKALEGKLSAEIAEAKLPKAVAASPVGTPNVIPASAKQPAPSDEVRPGG